MPIRTLIDRRYQVTESTDLDNDDMPFDYQPASRPDRDGCVRETHSLNEAKAIMQACFEARRREISQTQPEEFRIDVIEHYALDILPSE